MPKFRKKPDVVEALQLTQTMIEEHLFDGVPLPACLSFSASYTTTDREVHWFKVHIKTPEGLMEANVGDWIIKDIKGQFYPCKPDILEATYEAID